MFGKPILQMLCVVLVIFIGACAEKKPQEPVKGLETTQMTTIEWVEWRYPNALLMPGDLAHLPEDQQTLVAEAARELLEKQFTNQSDGLEGMVFSFYPLSEPRRFPKGPQPISTQMLSDRIDSTVGGMKSPSPHPVSHSFSPELFAVAVTRRSNGEPDKAFAFSAFLGALYQDEASREKFQLEPNPDGGPPDDAWILDSVYGIEPLVRNDAYYYKLTKQFDAKMVPLVWLTGKIADLADYPHGTLGPLTEEYK